MAVLLKSIFSIWAMKLTGLDSVLGDCFAHIFAQYNETIIVMNISSRCSPCMNNNSLKLISCYRNKELM